MSVKPSATKAVVGNIKLRIESGKATPAAPIGPALGQCGANIMEFCKEFNAKSQSFPQGSMINVKLSVYKDKKFKIHSMKIDSIYLLKKAAGITKGSSTAGRKIIGSVTKKQLLDIASAQLQNMNAYTVEQAVSILSGTAKSAGIEVKEV